MSIQNGGHLLTYASSLLSPGIFSHPVWKLFGDTEGNPTQKNVNDLLGAAKSLLSDEPGSACQVLFICAVYQSKSGSYEDSIGTIQLAYSTAEANNLTREKIWARWGASAICIQQGMYRKASIHLEDLQTILNTQDEWVLADYVEIINQSLQKIDKPQREKSSNASNNQAPDDLVAVTLEWLKNWGNPKFGFESISGFNSSHNNRISALATPKFDLFSLFRHGREGFVRILKSLFRTMKMSRNDKGSRNPAKIEIGASSSQITAKNNGTLSLPRSSSQSSVSMNSPTEVLPEKIATPQKRKVKKVQKPTSVNVFVQMLGPFNIIFQESHLKLPNSRGLSILKYLLIHHDQGTPREMLMDIFWPEASPESARNSLNVALYSLRNALRQVTDLEVIHFENGAYRLGSTMELWLDVEEFEHCVDQGQRLESQQQITEAIAEYEIAINLYRGDFLAENPYEGWTVLERERLRITYLDTLDHLSQIYFNQERYGLCITLCQLILNRDLCREDAHCRLMRCYSRLGQGPLALRQYQICAEALRAELEVDPAPETTQLYERIHRHEHI
jgi:DNA-binding SARP family transcriptional activator